jgi:hypothetical protein
MRVTCERCLRRYDVPDATVKGRKIRARCKCGARVVVQDEERAAKSLAAGSQTTGSIQRPVRWFVDITSWEPIAMDLRQLVRAFDAGRIDADTLVWRKGMPDWRRLRDVSELAERLVGGEGTAKLGSEPPAADVGASGSEPPPRQAERSRTPPASYTVGARSASEPPPALSPLVAASSSGTAGMVARNSSFPPSPEADGRGERSSQAPLGESADSSHAGPRSAPRPPSRRGRGKTPSRPNAAPLAPSRTVTQTGLESPAEVVARNSTPPPAAGSTSSASIASANGLSNVGANGAFSGGTLPGASATSIAALGGNGPGGNGLVSNASSGNASSAASGAPASDETGRPSAAPVAAASGSRTRDSRNPTPAGGLRRQSSSDETPAQKPSSVSVPPPPGILTSTRSRPRGRRLLAMAAVVFGALILIKQLSTSTDGAASTAQQRVDSVSEPTQVDKALEPKAAGSPTVAESTAKLIPSPNTKLAPPAMPGPEVPGSAAPTVGATPMNVEASATEHTASVGSIPARPAEATSSNSVVNEAAAATAPGAKIPAAPAAAPGATAPTAAAPAATARAAVSPAAPAAVGPVRPATPVATAPVRPAQPAPPAAPAAANDAVDSAPRAARTFDVDLATRQFEAAAAKAAACGKAGSTRGTGRVRVAIQPWGRVGRVTHLNEDFAGTQVGACVMEAFQQIQIPPFDGNSRSIAGDFVIQ